jgi:hypothetical protein
MRESFNSFAVQALAAVERDAPACTVAMAKAMGETRIVARVDGAPTVFRCEGASPKIDGSDPGPVEPDEHTALLETTARALVHLLAGRDTLLDAVRSNAVRVRAPSGSAARLFDAMRAFVEGVARSPEATALYERFRRSVDDPMTVGGGA